MSTPILTTKFYVPPPRPKMVLRRRLVERLDEGLDGKLTLISAPAGFGKTTLIGEWGAGCERPVAWLSLDEGDNDPTRFLTYFVAALQTIKSAFGKGVLGALQSPQPPPTESILTALLNEITTITDHFVLVLDDYHVMDAKSVDHALAFLLGHLPPQMHLVIATREDPDLPLARLRAQGELTELRAADLRFTLSEAAGFLNQVMGLDLSEEDIAALETCTEGWIAGLQLAALSMQGHPDATGFIKSFTGSHHFVLDYLVEEVLHQQPESIQTFLLHTSILDRLCGPLCDAVLSPSTSGQATLEYLEHANLFIVSLDSERRWYRYHHLFADLLRQRLHQSIMGDKGTSVAEYHGRASRWFEDNGLEVEAFHHAAAANDIDRAEQLIAGKGMPLHFRGALVPVFNWLSSLPTAVLDARPGLWVTYAVVSTFSGRMNGVEQYLQAAEKALQDVEPDDKTQDIEGQIAAMRALLAAAQNQADTILALAHRALELLRPDNLAVRSIAVFALGVAYQIQGDRTAASRAYAEVLSIGQASGNVMFTAVAQISLGNIQETENQLRLAAETYRHVLNLVGDPAQMVGSEAYQGLARIFYEWNDLDAAEQYWQHSARLALQLECDTSAASEVLQARLKLAQGDVAGAATVLAQASARTRENNLAERMPHIAAAQVLVLLHQGELAEAARITELHDLPISRARVLLAQGEPSAALAVLETLRQQMDEKARLDERLKVMVLQSVALYMGGEKDEAVYLLEETLALAEPGGLVRLFIDEGLPMAQLLSEVTADGLMPDYTGKLLAAFEPEEHRTRDQTCLFLSQPLIEPLSRRELEVLQLIAQGLSNREIGERLFLALSTVKGHSRIIYDKLQVQRRTEAVARARELGLL